MLHSPFMCQRLAPEQGVIDLKYKRFSLAIVLNDDVSRMKQGKRAQVAVWWLWRVNSCTRPFHSDVFLN